MPVHIASATAYCTQLHWLLKRNNKVENIWRTIYSQHRRRAEQRNTARTTNKHETKKFANRM